MKNIGQTSQLTGLSQRMLRYFEEQGLLEPTRTESGIRRFSDTDISTILRIRKLHELGFTYPEIRGLLRAGDEELARRGTALLQKHHEAALDLQDRIHELELICFGERRTAAGGPNGRRTLDAPYRAAHALAGAGECAKLFQEQTGLKPEDFCYWKFSWIDRHLAQSQEFSLYEILEGSALLAVFKGDGLLPAYEQAWAQAGLGLGARKLGGFSREDLPQFFGAQEIVVEQRHLDAAGETAFHVLLPYGSLFARLGRAPLQEIPEISSVSFRALDFQSLHDFELIARWEADASIRHVSTPHRDEKSLANIQTAEQLRTSYQKTAPFAPVEKLMILKDGKAIGHCSLLIDPPHRLMKEGKVGWLAIVIGEENFRARGLGKQIADHLELLARKHGADRIELGIFEFNAPALRACRAAGYEEFGRVENCTYWQGRYWADIRFRRMLD